MMPRDSRGSFIAADDMPKSVKPPYRGTTVWEGQHGDWQLVGRRIDGDSLLHCVARNQVTGIAHAERIDAKAPGQVKAWADGLLAVLPSDWMEGQVA